MDEELIYVEPYVRENNVRVRGHWRRSPTRKKKEREDMVYVRPYVREDGVRVKSYWRKSPSRR